MSPSIFNIFLSYLLFLLIVPVSLNFFVFSVAKLTIKFSIIYDNATADINKDPPIKAAGERRDHQYSFI